MTCIHPQQERTHNHATERKRNTNQEVINMDRKFGVELELVEITREQAVRALTGVGIAVREEGYNHETRRHWKIVSDSSVRGGFEVVSPVLQGEAGLDEVRKATTALDDMGATANRSCGYHVHLDAEGLTASDIRAIVAAKIQKNPVERF